MKKSFWLLLIALFIAVTSISAQDKVEQVVENTTATVEKVSTEANATAVYITEKLTELAKSLQTTAEHLYKTIVVQQRVNAFVDISIIMLLLIAGLICIKVAYVGRENQNKYYRSSHKDSYEVKDNPGYNYYDWDETGWLSVLIPGGICLAGAIIFALCKSQEIFYGFYNQEYGALKEIMYMLK